MEAMMARDVQCRELQLLLREQFTLPPLLPPPPPLLLPLPPPLPVPLSWTSLSWHQEQGQIVWNLPSPSEQPSSPVSLSRPQAFLASFFPRQRPLSLLLLSLVCLPPASFLLQVFCLARL